MLHSAIRNSPSQNLDLTIFKFPPHGGVYINTIKIDFLAKFQ